jgi:hypothetical protein
MSILTAQVQKIKKETYNSEKFSLEITQKTSKTYITMYVKTPTVNTYAIPQTYTILANTLPSILRSTCFNDAQLPFFQEVLHTEIGHLFEHILLEYLCELKMENGYKDPIHNGVTEWDWLSDPRGTFHIKVDAGIEDTRLFFESLSHSISLLEEILEYDPFRKERKKKNKQVPLSYNLN